MIAAFIEGFVIPRTWRLGAADARAPPSGLAPEFPLPLAGLLAPFASLALRTLGVTSRAFLGLAKLPAALLVRFGLAGRQPIAGRRRGIDGRPRGLPRQGDDIERRAGDAAEIGRA